MRSLTIAGRWNVNLHNLNNEGTEGNFIQPRTVTVVRRDAEGRPHLFAVNAISGDMMKHIHADYFRRIALDAGAGDDGYSGLLPLCDNSARMDGNRISTDVEMVRRLGLPSQHRDKDLIDYAITNCSLTDLHGTLLTQKGKEKGAKGRSIQMKSRIEFGWTVAVPEASRTGHYIHTKYAVEESTKRTKDKDATNEGQALFHRPASSAEYAFLAHVEVDRIGLNDVTLASPISDEARQARVRATLHALVQTLLNPYGAGRSQQAPHVGGFTGVVITSDSRIPAATVSPLEDDFREQAEAIVEQMNRLGGQLKIRRVDGIADLASCIADLAEGKPLAQS